MSRTPCAHGGAEATAVMSAPALPTISVVTPSLNRARYLEETIRSVLDQGYPRLEYVVVDGGSTDGSAEVVRRHAGRLAWWCSEPDGGPFDAIDKGFAHTGGEVMAWINSDDKYAPWAFAVVGEIFATFPEVEWITSLFPLTWDREGRAVACLREPGFPKGAFLTGDHLVDGRRYARRWIQQESTFWRRSLWERAGARLDRSLRAAGDFELWCRFSALAEHIGVETPLAGFRSHGDQISERFADQYVREARTALESSGGRLRGRLGAWLHFELVPRLPVRIRRPGVRFGLLAPRKVCRYLGPGDGWQVMEE